MPQEEEAFYIQLAVFSYVSDSWVFFARWYGSARSSKAGHLKGKLDRKTLDAILAVPPEEQPSKYAILCGNT